MASFHSNCHPLPFAGYATPKKGENMAENGNLLALSMFFHRNKTVISDTRNSNPESTYLIGGSTAVRAYAILIREGDHMLETIQIPILLKAIDFVFEEGRRIFEERRARRKAEEASAQSVETEPVKESPPAEKPKEEPAPESAKQDLIASKIDKLLWRDNEEEVQHLVRLLETYTRNYQLAKEQYAKWGSALVPPIIMHNLTEAENSVVETTQKLETVLSKVYQKDITPNE